MVRSGERKAPVVIGRDHLDSGSVASPNCETESMQDGSDAVSDWPLLNAMLNVAGGATWVSLHHGGGVGMGYRSEEHTSELQSLMRISYAVFCLKKKTNKTHNTKSNKQEKR